jgi:hypothetical protein
MFVSVDSLVQGSIPSLSGYAEADGQAKRYQQAVQGTKEISSSRASASSFFVVFVSLVAVIRFSSYSHLYSSHSFSVLTLFLFLSCSRKCLPHTHHFLHRKNPK